jgi:hypothetical protein
MNYIHRQPQTQLPTPSTSGSTKRSHHHIESQRNNPKRLHSVVSSLDSSYSFNSSNKKSVPAPPSTVASSFQSSTISNQLRKSILRALQLAPLRSISPENWDVDQVSFWLNAMDFGSIADNFKCKV